MADWEDSGEAQQGDLSNDRAGQQEYNIYHNACRTYGASSSQAREALGKALKAGWTFEGLRTAGKDRRSGRDRRQSPGVGETGGPPTPPPSKGNGRF